MSSKIISEARGSGITRHTRTRRIFDTTQPLSESEGAALLKGFEAIGTASRAWGWFEREVAIAERTIRAIEQGAPGSDRPDLFEPYVGPGWYSQEILARANWIESAKKAGNWELLARFSFELGQLTTQIGFKNAFDDDVNAGARHRASRESANAENRLASHSERKAIVSSIMAERGRGVRDACAAAAVQFPELGTKATFKESYYKKAV